MNEETECRLCYNCVPCRSSATGGNGAVLCNIPEAWPYAKSLTETFTDRRFRLQAFPVPSMTGLISWLPLRWNSVPFASA